MAKSSTFKMTKQMQQILVALLILVVIIYAVKKYREKSEQDEIKAGTNTNGVPTQSTGSSIPSWQKKYNALPSVGDSTLLKKGSKNKEVWQLQYLYNENIAKKEGKSKISVDGIFGSQTESAVKYVTENKYSGIKLIYWKSLVKMTKAQRVNHFKSEPTGTVYMAGGYDPLTYTGYAPADNTFVFNP